MNRVIKCEQVSWEQVSALSYKLALQIMASGYEPSLVIAIARGGYVPARLLCDYLDVYDLTSIRVEHYTAGPEMTRQARLMMPLAIGLEKQSILLVDDVDDTGDTLKLAVEYLARLKPDQLKVAVLHHKVNSSLVPDYYADTQYEWRWLTYPWAVVEDVKGFIARLESPPENRSDLIRRLQQKFNMHLTPDELNRIEKLAKRPLI